MNTENRFTAQAAGAYLGCEVYTYSGQGVLERVGTNGVWYVDLYSGGGTVGNLNDAYTEYHGKNKDAFPEGHPTKSILRPILSRLTSIDDEDAIEVAKICGIDNEKIEKLYLGGQPRDVQIYIGKGIVLFHLCVVSPWADEINARFPECDNSKSRSAISFVSPSFFRKIIDFLRSSVRPDGSAKQAYDCGCGEYSSLIDAGIAVERVVKHKS